MLWSGWQPTPGAVVGIRRYAPGPLRPEAERAGEGSQASGHAQTRDATKAHVGFVTRRPPGPCVGRTEQTSPVHHYLVTGRADMGLAGSIPCVGMRNTAFYFPKRRSRDRRAPQFLGRTILIRSKQARADRARLCESNGIAAAWSHALGLKPRRVGPHHRPSPRPEKLIAATAAADDAR
jgi:hypothetical protein